MKSRIIAIGSWLLTLGIIFAGSLAAGAEIRYEYETKAEFAGVFYAGDTFLNKGVRVGKITGYNTDQPPTADHPVRAYVDSLLAAGKYGWLAFPEHLPTASRMFLYTGSGGRAGVRFVKEWFSREELRFKKGETERGRTVAIKSSSRKLNLAKDILKEWIEANDYDKLNGWRSLIALDHLDYGYARPFNQGERNISIRPQSSVSFSAYTVAGLVFADGGELHGMVLLYNGTPFPSPSHPVFAYVDGLLANPPADTNASWKAFGYYSDDFHPCVEGEPCYAPPRIPTFTVKASGSSPDKAESFIVGWMRYWGWPAIVASHAGEQSVEVYQQLQLAGQVEDYARSLAVAEEDLIDVTITSSSGGSVTFKFPSEPTDPDSYIALDKLELKGKLIAPKYLLQYKKPFTVR